ncbi:MAG: response regulator transcription factor [Fluviicola sp.]|nr:response regulator transcription factor [Fluviicola sp.]
MNILIIEDEVNLANSLKLGLEENGYDVDLAFNGNDGLTKALSQKYQVIISDIKLPDITGLEFCTLYRQYNSETPILFLTALGTTEDKLRGFDVGADDYLIKPFSFDELLARIKVMSKRYNVQSNIPTLLQADDLILNMDSKTAERNGIQINLTAKEFDLIVYLIQNKNKIISKKEIAEKVWGINFETGTNSIEVYVNFTRNKIDKDFETKLIQTIHGRGYMIKDK